MGKIAGSVGIVLEHDGEEQGVEGGLVTVTERGEEFLKKQSGAVGRIPSPQGGDAIFYEPDRERTAKGFLRRAGGASVLLPCGLSGGPVERDALRLRL